MPEGINRQWLLAKRPEGPPGDQHFRWAETPVPSPGPGQALVQNLWLSLDPTMLLYAADDSERPLIPIGRPMRSIAVSRVVESRRPGIEPGEVVHGLFGWEDYSLTDDVGDLPLTKVAPTIPPNLALGTFGLTGMAAYFGVREIGKARTGETIVVSSAAGGVGSIAGQVARILGLRVIGIAGGKEKCEWLIREGGFAGAIDHRSEDVGARLTELCPQGIDIYFDNTGGPMLDEALAHLRRNARVVLCGLTSRYAQHAPAPGLANYTALIMERAHMEGFFASDFAARFPEAREALGNWLRSGQLKSKEDVVVGLENAPKALARVFAGTNVGKQLLRIVDVGAEPDAPA
jgi:NADPH-dependent curcumin reductase CurA